MAVNAGKQLVSVGIAGTVTPGPRFGKHPHSSMRTQSGETGGIYMDAPDGQDWIDRATVQSSWVFALGRRPRAYIRHSGESRNPENPRESIPIHKMHYAG